jgi:hypothetical protein
VHRVIGSILANRDRRSESDNVVPVGGSEQRVAAARHEAGRAWFASIARQAFGQGGLEVPSAWVGRGIDHRLHLVLGPFAFTD